MKTTRRRFLRQSAALIPTAGLIAEALALDKPGIVQGMNRIGGDVRINELRVHAAGMRVNPGDTVTTGANAQAIYVIGQNAYLQRESTTVIFVEHALRIVSGKLLGVFGKGEQQIITPTATIGIRGTACYIETEPYGETSRTYFCLCYGTADVVPKAAPAQRETIVTRHHDHPIWISNDAAMPKSMVPAAVMNHTDAELEMLEALVGRVPPFDRNRGSRY